jgi:hypothetical protein
LIGGTIPSTILPAAVAANRGMGEPFWSIPSRLSAERMKAGRGACQFRVLPIRFLHCLQDSGVFLYDKALQSMRQLTAGDV